jgi:DNA-binding IclR family transcriptional regulator
MKSPKKSPAPALSRGLHLLEFIAKSTKPQNLTTISNHMGIAMSSAHSICTTLLQEGYLEKQSDGSFHLTLKVLDLASSKIKSYEIVEHFNKACEENELIRTNGATLTVLEGPDVFFIATRNSPRPFGIKFRPGTRLPACCMASGRALLANLTDDEVCELYPAEEIPQVTKAHPKFRSELLKILQQVRQNGYSQEIKGTAPNMISYGALVAKPSGEAVAGVSISLHEDDVTDAVSVEAIEAIKNLAARLSSFADLVT